MATALAPPPWQSGTSHCTSNRGRQARATRAPGSGSMTASCHEKGRSQAMYRTGCQHCSTTGWGANTAPSVVVVPRHQGLLFARDSSFKASHGPCGCAPCIAAHDPSQGSSVPQQPLQRLTSSNPHAPAPPSGLHHC
jgi:hypothetical protein